MARMFLMMGSVFGFLAVALGAFGAHGLRNRLTPDMLAVFETGVRYHMYHALGLIALGGLMDRYTGMWMTAAGYLFIAGIVLFSGSLYALAMSGITILGAITPFGGLAFLLGWICLAVAVLR
jgi:uncharacterized membrane protein YgdD (TMEM256/DUF423 family)